jgi:hypothetical protein
VETDHTALSLSILQQCVVAVEPIQVVLPHFVGDVDLCLRHQLLLLLLSCDGLIIKADLVSQLPVLEILGAAHLLPELVFGRRHEPTHVVLLILLVVHVSLGLTPVDSLAVLVALE